MKNDAFNIEECILKDGFKVLYGDRILGMFKNEKDANFAACFGKLVSDLIHEDIEKESIRQSMNKEMKND